MSKKYEGKTFKSEAGTQNKKVQCSTLLVIKLKYDINEMQLHIHQITKIRKVDSTNFEENVHNGNPHVLLAGM